MFLSKEFNINHRILFYKKQLDFENEIEHEICYDLPNAFCKRKQHVVNLPYEDNFSEKQIPIKARPIQRNVEFEQHCRL